MNLIIYADSANGIKAVLAVVFVDELFQVINCLNNLTGTRKPRYYADIDSLRGSSIKPMRVRPSKTVSLFSIILIVAFVVVGISMVVPGAGLLGVLWTTVALGLAVYHGINAFSKKGIANFTIESDSNHSSGSLPFDEQLRRLSKLKEEGLISEVEFQQKREEIMRDHWSCLERGYG